MNKTESKLSNTSEVIKNDEIDCLIKNIDKISISEVGNDIKSKDKKNYKLLEKNERRRTQLINDVPENESFDKVNLEMNESYEEIKNKIFDEKFFSTVTISDSEIDSKQNSDLENNRIKPPCLIFPGWNWNSKKCQYYLPSKTGRIKRNFYISPEIYSRLKNYPHQYDGIRWMWKRMKKSEGGILADEMGLGKTIQTCVFIGGLFRSEIARFFMIILPTSLINQWKDELNKWCPKISKFIYHGTYTTRNDVLNNLYSNKTGGILITTFETLRNDAQKLSSIKLTEINCDYIRNKEGLKVLREDYIKDLTEKKEELSVPWDVVIIDEAHRLKNYNTSLFKSVQSLKSYCNILCTGTPLQNKLSELWSLIQCAKPGLLGKNIQIFNYNYIRYINKLNSKNISKKERESSMLIINKLKNILKPYILRRNKKIISEIYSEIKQIDFSKNKNIDEINKFDIILWHNLSSDQSSAYLKILDSQIITRIFNKNSQKNNGDILKAINLLLKVCKHPLFLLKDEFQTWRISLEQKKKELNILVNNHENEDNNFEINDEFEYIHSIMKLSQLDVELLRHQSAKLEILFTIIPHLVNSGKKILLFTESLLMMDMIEFTILIPNNISWERLEGKKTLEERKKAVESFNENEKIKILLLSKQVGSMGLNLISANRIIIVEPHWNPTQDEQAIGRAHRIGQKSDVIVYRLVSMGTVEDWKLRLQLHKTELARKLLGEHKRELLLSNDELNCLFSYSESEEINIQKAIFEFGIKNDHYKILEEDISKENMEILDPLVVAYLDFENIKRCE